MLLSLPSDILLTALEYLQPGEGAVLREASRAHRDRVHHGLLGVPHCLEGQTHPHTMANTLLPPSMRFDDIPPRIRVHTDARPRCVKKTPIHPMHFETWAQWKWYHFKPSRRPCIVDSVRGLPLTYSLGPPRMYRASRALID